jgi:hypothetical protein
MGLQTLNLYVTPVFGKVFFGKLFVTSVNTGQKFFYSIELFITMTIYIIILLVVYKCWGDM